MSVKYSVLTEDTAIMDLSGMLCTLWSTFWFMYCNQNLFA